MKHFWALPAVLRPALVLASQHAFSVQDDLLAFPQYEINFSEDYVSEEQAQLHIKSNGQIDTEKRTELEHYTGRSNHGSHENADSTKEEKLEYEMMIHHKQRYLCSIPQVEKAVEQPNENDTLSKVEQEKELARANDRGWELLSGMQGNCIYYLQGWWSYRFCYNKDVKQFHQLAPARGMPVYPPVEDPNSQGYLLGRYDEKKMKHDVQALSEEKWEGEGALEVSEHATRKVGGQGELVSRGESRYLVQRLDGGTECDLTGRERKIEVQYHCNPSIGADRITLIKETSTCAYLMVLETPRLCNDVAFQPPQKDEPNGIVCRPVLAPEEVEDYEHNQKIYAETQKAYDDALQESKIWEANPDAAAAFGVLGNGDEDVPTQIVGDIIIGGRNIVPEDVEIQKSGIVGGVKERFIDTIASSWGKDLALSEEDMKRLGLQDAKAIEKLEKLKKELKKQANGETWRLDVVDTPHGREYRGIYGEGVEEEVPTGDLEGKGRAKAKAKAKAEPGKDKKASEGGATGGGVAEGGSPGQKKDEQKEESEDSGGDEQGSQEEYFHEEL